VSARADDLASLRDTRTIRMRAQNVLGAGTRGELTHFAVDMAKLADVARFTAEVTRRRYPALVVPPHSRAAHFDAGGVARLAALERTLVHDDPRERARVLTDVIVTSVLLDAGAGDAWRYREADTGLAIGRSEGLAVASLAWVRAGGLSSRGEAHRVDAAGLQSVTADALAEAFQVDAHNPLVGLDGRVHLLRALGAVLAARPDVFGTEGRLGNLVDSLAARAPSGVLPASVVLGTLLDALAPIWPGRLSLHGVPLGDVWPHPHAGGEGATRGLVPFHKLSQWLTLSLIHPLAAAGLTVSDLSALTALAEYRNGGLLVDFDVLTLKDPAQREVSHAAGSELVVEWRALTVALLDWLVPMVGDALGVQLGLPEVLEGGTWAAGRERAHALREGGGPPLRIESDGTVF